MDFHETLFLCPLLFRANGSTIEAPLFNTDYNSPKRAVLNIGMLNFRAYVAL
jgi:hypothetical protein